MKSDDKVPRCVWGERLVGKHSHRVYRLESFVEPNQVKVVEEIMGRETILPIEKLFENFEHYKPWCEIWGRRLS